MQVEALEPASIVKSANTEDKRKHSLFSPVLSKGCSASTTKAEQMLTRLIDNNDSSNLELSTEEEYEPDPVPSNHEFIKV